jgi:arylsulfatase A-like enzyme
MRLLIPALLLLCSTFIPARAAPNILVILTDDQGYGDLSLHGNPVLETPHLDQLGNESVRFDNFHVTPVCATTRASLLTGRNHHHTGVWGVHLGRDYMRLDETTIGEVLSDAGYDTGMIGKWHNGRASAWLPWNRGFDDAWVSELYRHRDNRVTHNGKLLQTKGFADEALTDIALEFITRERDDRPFFLYLAYMTPHAPLVAPEPSIEKYRRKGCSETFATLNGMIDFLDTQIGRLLAGLESADLAGDTVVVFLTDNGPNRKPPRLPPLTDEEMALRNFGMRGQKGNIYENGHRVPCFFRFPRAFEPAVVDALADITDLYPTLLDLAGVAHPAGAKPIHGTSLVSLLQGDRTDWTGSRTLFKPYWTAFPRENWNRNGAVDPDSLSYENQINAWYRWPYKLVHYRNRGPELYNLEADPGEEEDILHKHPELGRAMAEDLRRAFDDLHEGGRSFGQPRFPIGHPDYDAQDNVGEVLSGSMVPFCSSVLDEGNVVQLSHHSTGWQAPGDAQTIQVDVVTPGWYDVVLEAGRFSAGTKVRLEVGESALDVTLPEQRGRVSIGQMALEAGPQSLRLSILEVPQGTGEAILKMKMAIFNRNMKHENL